MPRTTDDIYDELLVLRCRRNDVVAWDELVRRYNDRLFYYVRRMVSDAHDAAQLLQDVWVHVLRSLGSLRQGDRLAPWLYTITRRTVMSHYRDQYAAAEQSITSLPDEVIEDPSLTAAQAESAELVHFGLSRIGVIEREVLTLFFLEDLSIAEIATVLGIPTGTVKSRLSRARSELRRVLESERGSKEARRESDE